MDGRTADRRSFLAALGLPVLAPALGVAAPAQRVLPGQRVIPPGRPADDERYWAGIAREFTVDRSLVNLNAGGVSPAPRAVQEAEARYQQYSHQLPAHTMWSVLEPQREGVRERLGRAFGADPEEIAITRNASESLETLLFGFDLKAGDQVLCTSHDYPRMLDTLRQREQRDGIELVTFDIPAPLENPADVVHGYAEHITERTKLILVSHVVFLTGQILPVRAVCALGRKRGIPVIVDGAHALAGADFKIADLGCDYYASSLHKWLSAPHGTGLLYVAKDKVHDLWPLMAPPTDQRGDIRKFEQIGTHPAAPALGIGEALTLHESIGQTRKTERLVYLREAWAKRLSEHDRVRFFTARGPGQAHAIATFAVDGVEAGEIRKTLWEDHKIYTVAVKAANVDGVRVSPGLFSTMPEIERFVDVVERMIRET